MGVLTARYSTTLLFRGMSETSLRGTILSAEGLGTSLRIAQLDMPITDIE